MSAGFKANSNPGRSRIRDFAELTKPRVMSLSVFTALVGMAMAPGNVHPAIAILAAVAIALGAGAAGALNMWYDAELDRKMARTALRPVPSGRVLPGEALSFGLILSLVSVLVLGLATSWLAGALLAFTIFFYAVIYTMWLKRATPQNIVIGGAAGALPPVIGWAAISGQIGIEPVILFLIIFLWTPPHFWALALLKMQDYANVDMPMMPNVAGESSTRRQIFIYSAVVAPVAMLPWLMGTASFGYGLVATILGVIFVGKAWVLLRAKDPETARKPARSLFLYSILYLFLIFSALLADALLT